MLKQDTLSCMQDTFSQTIKNNEKHLSAILDTLDNDYYWQDIPEDYWGRIPPEGYWKKYPFRVELYKLLDEMKKTLEKPMSADYLLALYDPKHTRKIGRHYNEIADKIISFQSDSICLKLWGTATAKSLTDPEYLDKDLTDYVVREFVRKGILKDKTKSYILQNKDFEAMYYNFIDKEIDILIIDEQIAYLKTEMMKKDLGDSPRWANLLFDKMITPIAYCQREYTYYMGLESRWDNYDDKKNVKMTIRILENIKKNYDQLHIDCKKRDDEVAEHEKQLEIYLNQIDAG
jgi:hypothetical protein